MKLLTLSTRTINNGRGNGRKGVGGGEETEECQQLMKKCAAFFNQSSLPREFMGEKSVLKENVKGAILGIYRLFIFPFFNKLKRYSGLQSVARSPRDRSVGREYRTAQPGLKKQGQGLPPGSPTTIDWAACWT